jgi:hypothetical protein
MRHHTWKPILLALAAFSLAAVTPLTVRAQDHPEEHQQKSDEHHDDNRDRRDDQRGDPATQYRRDHPHSSARCHDGFFTSTHDRNRACSKHGGIDVWLMP